MNSWTRGVRNAFRNGVRTVAVGLILALAIGLALAMLVARAAVNQKIASVESSIGNNITITPAGMRGFGGGFGGDRSGAPGENSAGASCSTSSTTGNYLTDADLKKVAAVTHVATTAATMRVSVASTETNLTSPTPDWGSRNATTSAANNATTTTNSSDTTAPTMPVSATGATNITASIKELGDQVAISSGSSINGTSDDLVALVGDQMASTNNLSVGSTFTLYGKTITVKGILADSSSSTNSSDSTSTDTPGRGRNLSIGSALILPLATLQNLSGKTDQISSITATVDNVSNTDAVVSAITTKLGTDSDGNNRADVTSDKANAQTAIDSLAGIKTTSLFSLIACAVAAIVIIFLAMLMIVRERRQEIGVLKAVGAGAGTIIKQFVAESLTLTLLAGVIGLGVGVIAAGPLTSSLTKSTSSSSQTASNNMPGQPGQNTPSGSTNPDSDQTKASSADANRGNFMARGFDRIGTISAQINWWIVLWALGAAVLIAAVGATAASLFAMRVKPAEAVRAE